MKRFTILLALAIVGCGGTSSTGGGIGSGIAVIDSDYMSTVLSLANPDDDMLAKDDCLDSGSVTASLSMALSGDVVIPTSRQPSGELVLIDRTNAALDYLVPTSCTVARQLSVATGFYSNPHDVLGLSMTKAYVTRYEANAMAGKTDDDGGNDLLIINPSTGAITGRIDLAASNTMVNGKVVEARPDRLLLANGSVFVVLGEASEDYKTLGTGKVAVIDPASDKVTSTIDLGAVKGCSSLDYDDHSKMLVVACGGDYNDPTTQVSTSALVLLDVSGAPKIAKTIAASATGNAPMSADALAFVGDGFVLTATDGDFSTVNDTVWAVSIASGAATKVFVADNSYTIGSIVWSAVKQQAFVTDASMTKPLIHVIDVSNPAAMKETASFVANPKSGLPPRQIAWY